MILSQTFLCIDSLTAFTFAIVVGSTDEHVPFTKQWILFSSIVAHIPSGFFLGKKKTPSTSSTGIQMVSKESVMINSSLILLIEIF